jgi:pyruvate kinase
MRRTRVLATVGPASDSVEKLRALLVAGADAFRLNLSHGSPSSHREILRRMQSVVRRRGGEVPVVADLPGPKLRLGELSPSPLRLVPGRRWVLDRDPVAGDTNRVPVELPSFSQVLRRGDPILVGDGSIELRVVKADRDSIVATVIHGGLVSSHAGLYLPHARLRASAFSETDHEPASAAVAGGADFLALSFVRSARDLLEARRWLDREHPEPAVGLIAKIERPEALREIDGILAASDGLMIARGDLGIEVPLERLALEQKRLVYRANVSAKFSIVATQMLLSMISSPRPTRAEATDVANAVIDGADVLMLSEESAIGEYPVESVRWLARIAAANEPAFDPRALRQQRAARAANDPDLGVARAAVDLAEAVSARLIATPTHSGRTARLVAALHPRCPVVALSSSQSVRCQLRLVGGIITRPAPLHSDLALLSESTRLLPAELGLAGGGVAVLTAGYPVEGRPTNLLTLVDLPATGR